MGASHARGFIAEGANVVIADVLEQEGRTLADELGDHAIFSRLDVTSDRDWAATVAAAEDAFGPVSVLVNNAGIVRFGPITDGGTRAACRAEFMKRFSAPIMARQYVKVYESMVAAKSGAPETVPAGPDAEIDTLLTL